MTPAKNVLIVEDEEILADNLKAYLERSKCHARIAGDGATAIAMAEAWCPEVVVLDFRLPDMNGFAIYDWIRARCDFRCVMITGHPTSEVYAGAVQRGIEHILFKPFPLRELSDVVLLTAANTAVAAGTPDADSQCALEVERRKVIASAFPVRLYDGSWVFADRRHPAKVDPGRGSRND